MRKLVISCSILLFAAGMAVNAADAEEPFKRLALEVQFSRDLFRFEYEGTAGATLSLRYATSPTTSIRFGLDYRESYVAPSGSPIYFEPWVLGARAHILFYSSSGKRWTVRGYAGGGPMVGIDLFDDDEELSSGYWDVSYDRLQAGVDLVAGAEWFPLDWLSLAGEYGVFVGYLDTQLDATQTVGGDTLADSSSDSGWWWDNGFVTVNLAVYLF